LLAQLLSHLRPDNLDVADAKVGDKEIVLQRATTAGSATPFSSSIEPSTPLFVLSR
jgi:hypothetical protein